MKITGLIRVTWVVLAVFLTNSAYTSEINALQARQLIDQLYQKYSPMYNKYRGIESRRNIVMREYDPETNQLLKTVELTIFRRDFFYDKSESQVLNYRENGVEKDPQEFHQREGKPTVPVFDQNGRQNYTLSVDGVTAIKGKNCYKVHVLPLAAGMQYFSGYLYFTTDKLEHILTEGTVGELSFPLKELDIQVNHQLQGDYTAMTSGKFSVRVYIPLVQPDRRFVSEFQVLENKPILPQ